MQGAYYTYLVGINNTLEKRFAIRSQISSIVNMADNISPISSEMVWR
ncbi:solute carrier organic anion transporter family member 1C1-like [Tropilaelaps mercedesae]|uniref:Solute carrier organic anion transporter family member 1C1-like n=1 Tax=Tropilaelaps mercedesae TaxID=418985 RepID=A0A1V9X4U8_9ACAR|nr:solute carrier organic anion transporter family member 1C1-like [Tropilaelaps mercedesae]